MADPAISFTSATAVSRSTSHTYTAHFPPDWCIGTVPHGGFVTAVFLRVASTHFSTTLSRQHQPHTITLHLSFLRRTSTGPATFTVRDVKLGRQTSTIHVSLSQTAPDGQVREEVVGYLTNANLATETGPSFTTDWALQPPPPPADVAKLRAGAGGDTNWAEMPEMPFSSFRKASTKVRFFLPRAGQVRGVIDEWMALRSGERFDNESVGFVADMFPQIVEGLEDESVYQVPQESGPPAAPRKKAKSARYWYPTLLLNLDVKKTLPDEGAEFLFCRVRAKSIKNGRYDLEVVILDEEGDIVALSHHVALVLPADRNLSERRKQGGWKGVVKEKL